MIKHLQEIVVNHALNLADQTGSEQPAGWLMAEKLHSGVSPHNSFLLWEIHGRCSLFVFFLSSAKTLSENDKILATVATIVSAFVWTYCTSI